MFYETEYPKVYSANHIPLSILKQPITWFKPYMTGLGQVFVYRMRMKKQEREAAKSDMSRVIIRMQDSSEILIGVNSPEGKVKTVVLYLHTVCGNYTQLAHVSGVFKEHQIAYITYTRSGNDHRLNYNKFNFVGRIDELQTVIRYIKSRFPNTPIHAVGASAGSALLIRYLGAFNQEKHIQSAVLVSPGYNFVRSCRNMNTISKAYLVNKMKYMVRHLQNGASAHIKSIETMDDWLAFQSKLLGYANEDEYIRDCDPVHYLTKINVPSLFISSLDDNVFSGSITSEYIDLPQQNPNIILVTTNRGGHVMFNDVGYDVPWFIRVIKEWVLHQSS